MLTNINCLLHKALLYIRIQIFKIKFTTYKTGIIALMKLNYEHKKVDENED